MTGCGAAVARAGPDDAYKKSVTEHLNSSATNWGKFPYLLKGIKYYLRKCLLSSFPDNVMRSCNIESFECVDL